MRRLFRPLVIGLATAVALPTSAVASAQSVKSSCAPVHFVGVRGSGEAQGMGNTVRHAYESLRKHANVRVSGYALDYPATAVPVGANESYWSEFIASVDVGVANLVAYLDVQSKRCPSQRFVIAGYSQGAMVVDTALAKLPENVANRVDAVTLFGDPWLWKKFPHNVGSPDLKLDGIALTLLPQYWGSEYVPASFVDKTRSYCIAGDIICNFSFRNMWKCESGETQIVCPHGLYVSSGLTERAGVFMSERIKPSRAVVLPRPVPKAAQPTPAPVANPWVSILSTLGL